MTGVVHWIGLALALLFVAWGCVGFWRGLSLKPNDPLPPPGKSSWWRT